MARPFVGGTAEDTIIRKVRFTDEQYKFLIDRATKTGKSVSAVLRNLVSAEQEKQFHVG